MENENSLTQYIALLRENQLLLEKDSPEIFNRIREGALKELEAHPQFPGKGSERNVITDFNKIYGPDYGINLNRLKLTDDISTSKVYRCGVPNISTLSGIVKDEIFHPSESLEKNLPDGVVMMSLREASKHYPSVIEKYLGSTEADNFTVGKLNDAFLQDGVFIMADKDVCLEKPLQLVNVFTSPMPTASFRRILIVGKENSSLKLLLCDHSMTSRVANLSSQVVEVIALPGSKIELYEIEETSDSTSATNIWNIRQSENSTFTFSTLSLSGGVSYNSINIDLAGKGAAANISGLVIGTEERTIENNVVLRHSAPDCTSRQLFKYGLFDQSEGAFGGKIIVKEKSVHTNAAQTNRNLLIGTESRMHSDPQLEIYCDDVKASHGATTGQIDSRALFYMQTRGIPEEEARKMLVQAFMNDVIEEIKLEPLRDRLKILVEKRLEGDATVSCGGNCCK